MANADKKAARCGAPSRQGGFAIVLIAALFTAFAVIATVFLDNKLMSNQISAVQQSQAKVQRLHDALVKFLLKEGRLPCPARDSISPNDAAMADEYGYEMHPVKAGAAIPSTVSDCSLAVDKDPTAWAGTTVTGGYGVDVTGANHEIISGMVPFKALGGYGITEDDVYDDQGNRILYVVNRQLTGVQETTGDTSKDFMTGNASGYVTDRLTVTDKLSGTAYTADFVVVAFGADKYGGKGHDQVPTGNNCSASGSVADKVKNCDITPTVACPTTGTVTALTAENCNKDINFIFIPKNTSKQSTNDATVSSSSYFDDVLAYGSMTCSNGALNRSADGQCSNAYCWGNNSVGQLGNGTKNSVDVSTNSNVPVPVALPTGVKSFQAISVAGNTIGGSTDAIVCAIAGNAAVKPYGDAYCWGKRAAPAVTPTDASVPTKITVTPTGMPTGSVFKFTSLQVGYDSVCGMGGALDTATGTFTADGQIYCWGDNSKGQLGDPSIASWAPPAKPVIKPAGVSQFTGFSGDGTHWCAVGADAKLYCWGDNSQGQLGGSAGAGSPAYASTPALADAVMAQVPSGSFVSSVGGKGTTVMLTDGSLIGWTTQWSGSSPATVTLTTGESINPQDGGIDVAAQNTGSTPFQCVTSVNGSNASEAYCKGDNSYGELGDGTTTTTTGFTNRVQMPTGILLSQISVANSFACGLGSDGLGYCWGDNSKGQLGLGTTSPNKQKTPAKVILPTGVQSFMAVAAGGATSCALATP